MENLNERIAEFLKEAKEKYLPSVAINAVIFGFVGNSLNVLLMRFGETPYYTLPGGYVMKDEDLDDASLRVLKERTGLDNIYLEQFFTAGKVNRLGEAVVENEFKKLGWDSEGETWLSERKISVCYYALVDPKKVSPAINDLFVSEMIWQNVEMAPLLMYDHKHILDRAIERLQLDMDRKLISYNLMGEKFTMSELQKLYEAVYQRKFTRTNFQRKMLNLNILERMEKNFTGASNKAPYLYKFKDSVPN